MTSSSLAPADKRNAQARQALGLGGAALGGAVILGQTQPASAQDASAAIQQMTNDLTAIEAATAVIIPVAIASMVFGAGALLVKRFVYS